MCSVTFSVMDQRAAGSISNGVPHGFRYPGKKRVLQGFILLFFLLIRGLFLVRSFLFILCLYSTTYNPVSSGKTGGRLALIILIFHGCGNRDIRSGGIASFTESSYWLLLIVILYICSSMSCFRASIIDLSCKSWTFICWIAGFRFPFLYLHG